MRITSKHSFCRATFFVITLNIFATPTVSNVTAKQRYPWNGMVDIMCTVSGISGNTGRFEFIVAAVILGRGEYASASIFLPWVGLGWCAELADWSSSFYWSSQASGDDTMSWMLVFAREFDGRDWRDTMENCRDYGGPVRPLLGPMRLDDPWHEP